MAHARQPRIYTSKSMPPSRGKSRWNKLLTSNDQPLDHEVASINNIRRSAEAALSTIESGPQNRATISLAEIDLTNPAHRTQDYISQGARRDEQLALIRSCKTILSPSRRIPREVIAEILCHALDTRTMSPTAVTLDTTQGPWPFTQVSRLWREVAVELPELWSSIRISPKLWPGSRLPRSQKNAPALMASLMQRSKARLLHGEFSDSELDLGPIFSTHSSRFRTLKLFGQRLAILGQLNQAMQGFSALESLTLDITLTLMAHRRRHSQGHPELTSLRESPLLRSFTILPSPASYSSIYHEVERVLAPCPWEQINCYDGPSLVTILPRLSAAVTVHLRGKYDSISELGLVATLPQVRTLKVEDAHVLAILDLPALEHLEVEFPPSVINPSFITILESRIRALPAMISRSLCLLESLVLCGPSRSLIAALPRLTSLTTLCINDPGDGDGLVHALVSNASGFNLPNLESFKLTLQFRGDVGPELYFNLAFSIHLLLSERSTARPRVENRAAVARLQQFHCNIGVCGIPLPPAMFYALCSALQPRQTDPDVQITVRNLSWSWTSFPHESVHPTTRA